MNTSVWIPENSNYIKKLTILKFVRIFLFVEEGVDVLLSL